MTDFHKRSSKSRRSTEKSIARHVTNRVTPEEARRRKEDRRRRKAERRGRRPRRHDWSDEGGDALPDERMRRRRDEPAAPRAHDPARDDPPDVAPGSPTAVVVSVGRGRVDVLSSDGHTVVEALLPDDLAATQQTDVAVGDEVALTSVGGVPRVLAVSARRSVLARPDPANPHRLRVLAANIDVAVLVLSCRRPALRPGLADRFLVALADAGAAPLVVANKTDLLDAAERTSVDEALAPVAALGVPVVPASTHTGEGLDALAAAVRGRRAVLVGHSGVGKSSLLNALDPAGARVVGVGRTGDGKGRHTTTRSTLTRLPDGTEVVDTPGVRAFGLWRPDDDALRAAFPDVVRHAAACRFRDCSHVVEPDCGVRAAVDAGALAGSRLASWTRLIAERGD